MKGLDDESTSSGNRSSPAYTITNGDSVTQRHPMSLVQGLRLCQEAWNPGSPWDRHGAHAALWGRPAGSFLVVPDSSSENKVLCVSVGGQGETVQDFPILHTGVALHLATSHLAFSDLLQLVAFYTLSRDVLPLCLVVPVWVHSLADQPGHPGSQLGPKAWLCPSSDLQSETMSPGTHETPDTVMCSIQLTTASGALCIINPLYLQEHGDDWLTGPSANPQLSNRPGHGRRERRLSTARAWGGGALKKRGASLEEPAVSADSSGSPVGIPASFVTPEGVVLRRLSTSSTPDPLKRVSADSLGSQPPQSPHRVSWVEDTFWLNAPTPSTLLHPPCLELDSLSVSSMEEEPESTISPSQSHPSPRLPLANKVKNRLSAVGLALGGIVSPQRRLYKRVQEMSQRRDGPFAEAVRGFIEQNQKTGTVYGVSSTEMLQEVRTTLTGLREMLYDNHDIQSIIDCMGDVPDFEVDVMLEHALHKVALKPVYSSLYVCMKASRQNDDSLQRLEANQKTLSGRSLEELEGTAGAGVPDAVMLEKIQQRWSTMHQAYSPNKKVDTLLKVCKNIYHSMSANAKPGVVFGADDFLPCLTWVLLRSDVATLQLDTDYMMELLDPSQLQGEGGYYLTSLYAALYYISSFQPRLAVRQLSAEAHKSLSQWHRRRTLHCNQSRRSRNRRTFRRTARGETASTSDASKDAEEGSGKAREDSEDESDIELTLPCDETVAQHRLSKDLEILGEEEEEGEGQLMEEQH
ncbi:ras and Rab interactor 2 isoform X2 [Astyanax mexicanus]|uniref:ras and Rab interactor 2 isoform X2 n=1 Tax=Astyanax mexicanus TaxID=7994 RepID=UPI0020CAD840|nr:ras and Rab interactor 2 isoform X2 [Astyanax mexicanus]